MRSRWDPFCRALCVPRLEYDRRSKDHRKKSKVRWKVEAEIGEAVQSDRDHGGDVTRVQVEQVRIMDEIGTDTPCRSHDGSAYPKEEQEPG